MADIVDVSQVPISDITTVHTITSPAWARALGSSASTVVLAERGSGLALGKIASPVPRTVFAAAVNILSCQRQMPL
jgi:hypothetical protein